MQRPFGVWPRMRRKPRMGRVRMDAWITARKSACGQRVTAESTPDTRTRVICPSPVGVRPPSPRELSSMSSKMGKGQGESDLQLSAAAHAPGNRKTRHAFLSAACKETHGRQAGMAMMDAELLQDTNSSCVNRAVHS